MRFTPLLLAAALIACGDTTPERDTPGVEEPAAGETDDQAIPTDDDGTETVTPDSTPAEDKVHDGRTLPRDHTPLVADLPPAVAAAIERAEKNHPILVKQVSGVSMKWCVVSPEYAPLVVVETMASLRIYSFSDGLPLVEGEPPVIGSFYDPETETVFIDADLLAKAKALDETKRGSLATTYCASYVLADTIVQRSEMYEGEQRVRADVSVGELAGSLVRGYFLTKSGPDDLVPERVTSAAKAAREALAALEEESPDAEVKLRFGPLDDGDFLSGFKTPGATQRPRPPKDD